MHDPWARGQTDTVSLGDDVLLDRVRETIAWCSYVMTFHDANASMRTAILTPPIFHAGYDDVVCDVGSMRRYRTPAHAKPGSSTEFDLHGGRLFCLFPNGNLTDGAAEPESDGFFDIANIPPWDTWIGFFEDSDRPNDCEQSYLLCYAPTELVTLVDAGIRVNPEECIRWLEDTSVSLRSRLAFLQTGG